MPSFAIQPNNGIVLTVAASDKITLYSAGAYTVTQTVGYPTTPTRQDLLFQNSGAYTSSAFASATEVTIQAGNAPVLYMTGTGPVIVERGQPFIQGTPGTLNATGTLTAALILGGFVTSSTASAVTATLDTGTVMDTVIDLAIDDSFIWTAINTGGSNAFTVTAAASGHTIVGAGAVAANTSGRFLTRKTAANTFVSYRAG